jgi:hypothetical protein
MNAYRLNAWLPARQYDVQEYNFDFVAEDDDEARRMVDVFYRVCHPFSHGPLWRIGETDTRDGIKAIYLDDKDSQLVPLHIENPP